MTEHGRIGHKENDPQIIFACYVLEKIRPLKTRQDRIVVFNELTAGRDDIGEIREIVRERW